MVEKQFQPEIPKVSQPGACSPVETVAAYLRDLATRGMGCTTNPESMASAIGLPLETVRRAKTHLISAKRLVGKYPGQLISIDGLKFGERDDNDLDRAKTVLRRFYPLVCDARTVENPGKVPMGAPTALMVGSRVMSVDDAVKLAAKLNARKGL